MTLQKQLKQITEAGFERMPHPIAKVLTDGIQELKDNKLKENALKVGDTIPNAPLLAVDGQMHQLSDFLEKEFLVLNFYRGGWCPYCNLELRAYDKLRLDFLAVGADIIAISAEKPILAAQTTTKNQVTYPILTDKNGQLMKTIGILFQLNEQLRREYQNFGIDLSRIHGNANDELAVPAVYIINKNLEIVFAHIEENYMTRLEPKELLNTLTQKARRNLITH